MPRKLDVPNKDCMKEHAYLQKTITEYRSVKRLLAIVRGSETEVPGKETILAKRNRLMGGRGR